MSPYGINSPVSSQINKTQKPLHTQNQGMKSHQAARSSFTDYMNQESNHHSRDNEDPSGFDGNRFDSGKNDRPSRKSLKKQKVTHNNQRNKSKPRKENQVQNCGGLKVKGRKEGYKELEVLTPVPHGTQHPPPSFCGGPLSNKLSSSNQPQRIEGIMQLQEIPGLQSLRCGVTERGLPTVRMELHIKGTGDLMISLEMISGGGVALTMESPAGNPIPNTLKNRLHDALMDADIPLETPSSNHKNDDTSKDASKDNRDQRFCPFEDENPRNLNDTQQTCYYTTPWKQTFSPTVTPRPNPLTVARGLD